MGASEKIRRLHEGGERKVKRAGGGRLNPQKNRERLPTAPNEDERGRFGAPLNASFNRIPRIYTHTHTEGGAVCPAQSEPKGVPKRRLESAAFE